jgi:hypothetical protein
MRERSFHGKVPARRRWLLLAVGAALATMVYIAGYDVSGREPPCNDTSQLQRSHPDAVEFRNAGGGGALTQSCEALDVNGTVVGRVTYPGTADLVLAAVMLVAPLTADAAWRRFWRRIRRADTRVV